MARFRLSPPTSPPTPCFTFLRKALSPFLCVILVLAFLPSSVVAQQTWTATPFNTPSIPLAVKGPYVNVWAPQASGPAPLNKAWPRLWDFNIDVRSQFIAFPFCAEIGIVKLRGAIDILDLRMVRLCARGWQSVLPHGRRHRRERHLREPERRHRHPDAQLVPLPRWTRQRQSDILVSR